MNGGDRIATVLARHGAPAVFTLCGGHVSPLLVGAKRQGLRIIDVRDEASAVFAADAVARLTGTPGVAVVTAGPGVANTVTAVINARLAESPVLVLGGAAPTILRGRGSLQDVDQLGLMRPQVKYAERVGRVRDLAGAVDRAFARAQRDAPGPVFVECPVDLLYDEKDVRDMYGTGGGGRIERWFIERHLSRLFAPGRSRSRPAQLREAPLSDEFLSRAASALAGAVRPVLLLGSQAVRSPSAIPEIVSAVERLGVPVFVNGMARGLLPPGHPLLLRHRRSAALKEADLVIVAGVPFDFRLNYGRQIGRRARIVSVNLSARTLRKNRRPTHGTVGEPGRFVIALAESAAPSGNRVREWTEELRARDQARDAEIAAMADRPAEGINSIALCRAIDGVIDDDSVIVCDGGDFVGTAAYTISPRRPLSWLDAGPFGTLGAGGGFAIGANVVRPDAEIWLLYGDGAAGFSLAEFDTMARHGMKVIAVVGNDGSWAQIARDQVRIFGDDVATRLDRTAYHSVARGYGGAGFELTDPARMEAVLREAKAAARDGRPVLVNAMIGATDFREGSISL